MDLSSEGIYGVISYSITQQAQVICICMGSEQASAAYGIKCSQVHPVGICRHGARDFASETQKDSRLSMYNRRSQSF